MQRTIERYGKAWHDNEGRTVYDAELRDGGDESCGHPVYRLYVRGIRMGDVDHFPEETAGGKRRKALYLAHGHRIRPERSSHASALLQAVHRQVCG